MPTYAAIIEEGPEDLNILRKSDINLHVAKLISSPAGPPTFNVVYTSTALERLTIVAWNTEYGLNWTTNVPAPGAEFPCSGNWQPCDLGSSYDLTDEGEWTWSDGNLHADRESANIGENGYTSGVNIIVGVQDPFTLEWTPVCVFGRPPLIIFL